MTSAGRPWNGHVRAGEGAAAYLGKGTAAPATCSYAACDLAGHYPVEHEGGTWLFCLAHRKAHGSRRRRYHGAGNTERDLTHPLASPRREGC